MRLLRQKAPALAFAFVALLSANGCGSNPSGPLNPELSGNWISPSVDTYSEFSLQEHGDAIVGTLGNFAASQSFSQTLIVAGSADLPHVVLSWVQDGVNQTFDAALSEDQLTLTGTYLPGGTPDTVHRQRPISGRLLGAIH
jgi:hypothetical protein